jgi:HlyD family secretion protein
MQLKPKIIFFLSGQKGKLTPRFNLFIIFLLTLLLSACSKQDNIALQAYVDADYIYLSSAFPGNMLERDVRRGDSVEQGQLLFVLDPEPEASQLAQAQHQLSMVQSQLDDLTKMTAREPEIEALRAQVAQASAERDLAARRLKRIQDLFAEDFIDEDSLEETQMEYESALQLFNQYEANLDNAQQAGRADQIKAQRQAVKNAQAQVDEAQWALSQKTVYAPTKGIIFETYYEPGEHVPEGRGILSLLAEENIYIVFFVPEPLLNKVKYGQLIQVDCDSCEETYTAKIDYISSQVEQTPPVIFSRENNSKYVYQVKASPLEPQNFHPGQPVYVTLTSDNVDDA